MKIVLTTSGDSLESPLDSRFGRCNNFLLYDLDAKKAEIISNVQNINAAHGAGIQAAETVVKTGAKVVVTGHCGPKAFKVLKTAGIKIFHSDNAVVKEALKLYEEGKLTEVNEA